MMVSRQGLFGEEVGGVLGDEAAVVGGGGGQIGRAAVDLGDAAEEVARGDGGFVGGGGGGGVGELFQLGDGLVEVGVGLGLLEQQEGGAAEAGFARL